MQEEEIELRVVENIVLFHSDSVRRVYSCLVLDTMSDMSLFQYFSSLWGYCHSVVSNYACLCNSFCMSLRIVLIVINCVFLLNLETLKWFAVKKTKKKKIGSD